jgi:anti-sigma28 factor (negative regulator of flagellin synthesis)
MSLKTRSIAGLFILLTITLAFNAKLIHNIYSSILGRIALICLVIFFAINNVTLGLLAALIIIIASNQFGSFVEGMENSPRTIGEENVSSTGEQQVLSSSATEDTKKKISELKQSIEEGTSGIDKEAIKAAIMSKDSKQIPVNSDMNTSSEVSASSTGMLKPGSKLEGFSAFASV